MIMLSPYFVGFFCVSYIILFTFYFFLYLEGECSGSYTDSVDSCDCDLLLCSPKSGRGPQVNILLEIRL